MPNPAGLSLYDRVSAVVALHKAAGTDGGEWQGPCPWCGGRDRFHVWPDAARPHYWCRSCERHGDPIQWLRDHDGLSYPEAAAAVGKPVDPALRLAPRPAPLPPDPEPTAAAWQERGRGVLVGAQAVLASAAGAAARDYLHARGLTDPTIAAAGLGCNDRKRWARPETWGLEAGGKQLYLAPGIVIPHEADGQVWGLNVRRLDGGEPKYLKVRGSVGTLYGADQLAGHPVVIVAEGEFDCLLLRQEAGDLVDVVTLGSATAPLGVRWLARLSRARHVLVAYDADATGAKGAAALAALSGRVQVVRPLGGGDLTAMHLAGGNLRAWVQRHLARLVPRAAASQTSIVTTRFEPEPEPAKRVDNTFTPPALPVRRCFACAGTSWWRRPDGSELVCQRCHPDPRTFLEAAR